METIAVYSESVIRTYGFHLAEGLALGRIGLTPGRVAAWAGALHALAGEEPVFRLVWAQAEGEGRLGFFLLCDAPHWQRVQSAMGADPAFDATGLQAEATAVDLVHFHGPHFGDRYGILDYTRAVLDRAQVPLVAAVCSVATVHLVVPAGWGAATRTQLLAAFEIPQHKSNGRTVRDA